MTRNPLNKSLKIILKHGNVNLECSNTIEPGNSYQENFKVSRTPFAPDHSITGGQRMLRKMMLKTSITSSMCDMWGATSPAVPVS